MFQVTRKFSGSILVVLALLVSGCAGTISNMREVPAGTKAAVPDQGKALVVFARPSTLGFAIQSSVFEVVDSKSSLIGIVAAKTKVAHQIDPGKHLFMVIGESADFMTADLLPNKTYYAYVTPRMGMWKARFSLEPKHTQDLGTPELTSALDECRLVELTPASTSWAQGNMDSIQSKRVEYYADWLKTPEGERPVLRPEDGK